MLERRPPVYQHLPRKTTSEAGAGQFLRNTVDQLLDGLQFWAAAIATFVLAGLVIQHNAKSWWLAVYFLLIWAATAYLALPRVHAALSALYVPRYFIGRTFTGHGLLGDPINLAVDGSEAQIHEVMQKAGWVKADPISIRSSWRIAWSSIVRKSYPEAPVSNLYLFERKHDFAYQMEVEGNPAQRHHVRFWRTPEGWLLPGGERVDWLAAGTYDRSVGFSLFTLQITHKIDENIDIERDFIVDSVLYANADAHVRVLENFATGYHCRNGGGDVVSTDGNLPVVELDDVAVSPERRRAAKGDLFHQATASVAKRPMSILAGAFLTVFLFAWDITNLLLAIDYEEMAGYLTPVDSDVTYWIVIAIVVILAVVSLALAWGTYKGWAVARRWQVIFTTLGVFTGLQTLAESGRAGFNMTLVHTMLGVLVIYALTSDSARAWRGTKPRLVDERC